MLKLIPSEPRLDQRRVVPKIAFDTHPPEARNAAGQNKPVDMPVSFALREVRGVQTLALRAKL